MIEARGLVKRYGAVEAVRGVSFSVPKGEIVGLLGPNGAGKTTIMKVLTCYHRPTAGSASVDGHDVASETLAVRRSVGYLPENAPVYRDLRVAEYLDFVAQVRGFARRERRLLVERSMSLCGLTSMAYRAIDRLSKGYRQRVGLAQAIIHDPGTLILDEPTSGLDPNQIEEIRRLVRALGRSKTVVLSTHLLHEAENLCAKVLILNEGLVVADGSAVELARSLGARRTVVSLSLANTLPEQIATAAAELPSGATAGVPTRAPSDGHVTVDITLDAGLSESAVFEWAVAHGLTVVGMTTRGMDLESIFRALTRAEAQDA